MIYDMETIEAHAKKPAENWQTCECSSCERRRDLEMLALIMHQDDDGADEDGARWDSEADE